MSELFQTLIQLVLVLGKLVVELLALGLHWFLLIFWVAWWLLGVNWKRVWPVLARGAWAPLCLLTILVAMVWSQIWPSTQTWLGFLAVPNFWWQLGASTVWLGSALFAGWLQGVLGWAPADIDLDPPAHDDGHGHEHGGDHSVHGSVAAGPIGNGHHP